MLMMLGRVVGAPERMAKAGAADAHDAGPGLGASEKIAKASAADAHDAGLDSGASKSRCS